MDKEAQVDQGDMPALWLGYVFWIDETYYIHVKNPKIYEKESRKYW